MRVRPSKSMRSSPLDRETRLFMEQGLEENFRQVRITVRKHEGGPVAFVSGEHIVLAAGCYQPQSRLGKLVLAHELAHVVQKRRAVGRRVRSPRPAALSSLEAEAHRAAAVVAGGGRFRCVHADAFDTPRFWEEEGHYYTSYLVMLAAGLKGDVAQKMAWYAQVPDEVEELDAAGWGKKEYNLDGYWLPVFTGNRRGIPEPLAGYLRERDVLVQKARNNMNRDALFPPLPGQEWQRLRWLNAHLKTGMREQMLNIQVGLHCLSGGKADEETKVRAHRLLQADLGSIDFGLAIHAYGDSFSHRNISDPTLMYASGFGHAVDALKLMDPHSADQIDTRPEFYIKYGLGLYYIICKKASVKPLLDRQTLGAKLEELARIHEKPQQVQRIREIAAQMNTPMVERI